MQSKKLYLFTNKFPYQGGEPFLETEIHYLKEMFDEVVVIPQIKGATLAITLPENIRVSDFEMLHPARTRVLLRRHGFVIAKWWLLEFIRSTHRFKYISQFRWNFNRFIGILETATRIKEQLMVPGKSVYYSYWFNEWATALALAKDLGLNGNLITRAHGYDFDEAQQGRGYHPFRHSEIGKFQVVMQISKYGLKYMQRKFPNASNLALSYLGVEDNGIGPINVGEVYHIVSCSNFVTLKRIPLIARTLSLLKVKFHWTHFGDGPERRLIESEVADILKDNFTFKGYISNGQLMNYYKNSAVDLFINMSILEGIPVSMMEAISFGIPVVGYNICGLPEIVNDQTGLLLNNDLDYIQVANRIDAFLANTSRRKDYRMGVRQYWAENFNSILNYKNFANLVSKL